MPTFAPVDFDPFAGGSDQQSGPNITIKPTGQSTPYKLVPVEHDPFATEQPNTAMDVAKSGGIGVAKGVIGLAGMPGDIAELGAQGIDAATRFIGNKLGIDVQPREAKEPTLGSAQIQRGVESVTGDFYKPQTTAGHYAQTVGEFVPAMLGGPESVATRLATRAVIPGIASEAAGQATQGTAYEPYARFGGALAGGVGAGLALRPGTAGRAIQQQLPAGVTPQMVDQAQALMQQARQQGIDLAWPEALSQVAQRPVLTNVMRHLEAAPQTEAQMGEFFGRRPQQVETAARNQFDQVSPVNNAPSGIGPAVGRAAEGEINDTRQAINAASDPFYTAAERVRIPPADMARAQAVPGYAIAVRAIRSDPQLARYVAGLPEDSVGFLNEVKKYLDTAAENASSPVNAQRNMQRSAGFGSDATLVRDTARQASPDYGLALDIQSQGREQFLQPLLDGPLGKLAARDTTTQNAINALFPKNPLPNSQAEITDTVGRLARRSPRAATDLVRAHVESTFNQAAKDLQTGANQAGGAKFRAQLVGNPQQAANLQAAVEALPNGAQRWQGFNRFLDVMEALGTRMNPGSRTAYNEQFLKEAAKGGVVGDTVKTAANPMQLGQKFVDRYQQWRLGRNLGQLATILTDPGSANLLRGLARTNNTSRAQEIALRIATYGSASKPKPINEARQ